MIRTLMLSADEKYSTGDELLIQQWRESPGSKLWLDIQGEMTPELQELLLSFDCSELAIKDCARTRHPPKVENFEKNSFILFRGITKIADNLELDPQQIGMWVGENYLITVHRGPSVSIDHVLSKEAESNLLVSPNILAIKLLHFACGRYLEKLLETEERIGVLEDQLLGDKPETAMKELVSYRTRLRKLRRIFDYHLRLASFVLHEGSTHLGLENDESSHIRRDFYDRCERLLSLCSLYYELCGDLIEGYISLNSYELNNTMKVLTIITAIFVPLGFMAGLYGMNFEYMPELGFRYSYFILLTTMVFVASVMVYLFKRNKWL